MICLFLGNRNLPKLIIKSIKRKKINFFIIDLTKKNKSKIFWLIDTIDGTREYREYLNK